MYNFKLKDGKSGVLSNFERKAIYELYCFFIQICFYHPFFGSRCYKLQRMLEISLAKHHVGLS